MAVTVVAEKNYIDEKKGETDEHQHGQPPRLLVFDFGNQQDADQKLACYDGTCRQTAHCEAENVETVDVKFKIIDRNQFQDGRRDEKYADTNADDDFENIHCFTIYGLRFAIV